MDKSLSDIRELRDQHKERLLRIEQFQNEIEK